MILSLAGAAMRPRVLAFDGSAHAPRRRHAPFALGELGFEDGVDARARWIPEALTPVAHLPVHHEMAPEERLRYNQLSALAFAEKYVFLEEVLLVPALEAVLRSPRARVAPEVAAEMRLFCEEERKHSEAFWRLCEAAAPELYPRRAFRYVSGGPLARAFVASTHAAPTVLTAWIWLALFFEETTVRVSRMHAREAGLEPLFRRVHDAHMREEMSHVPLDRFFLEGLFDPQTSVGKRASLTLFGQFLRRFAHPRATPLAILREIEGRFPRARRARLASRAARELSGREGAEGMGRYREELYSPKAAPLTFALLRSYPESDAALARLPWLREQGAMPREATG